MKERLIAAIENDISTIARALDYFREEGLDDHYDMAVSYNKKVKYNLELLRTCEVITSEEYISRLERIEMLFKTV